MKPNNKHSNNIFSLLHQFGQKDIFSWNLTYWNPYSETIVNFCVSKYGFRGTISIQKIENQKPCSPNKELFIVAFQDMKWKETAMSVLAGDKIAEFITLLGGIAPKWSADVQPRVKGERAPMSNNTPDSAR